VPKFAENRGKVCLIVAWAVLYLLAYAQSTPTVPAKQSEYLESTACAECHRGIAESYSRTGMARSFGRIQTGDEFQELQGGDFRHLPSDEYFKIRREGGLPSLTRYQIGFDGARTNELTAQIDYWIGSGNHARSYLSRTISGALIELPLSWYVEQGGYWGMSPGYDRPDHAGFSRKINNRCVFCHAAYPQDSTSANQEARLSLPIERQGIDCQRCHGPGRTHRDAVRQGLSTATARETIVNPARLSPDRRIEVCLQCHLETTSLKLPATVLRAGRGVFSYRPGEPLENYILHFDRTDGEEDRYEFGGAAYRLRKSKCFLKSDGALGCTNCHNPHEPASSPLNLRRANDACRSCHQTMIRPLIERRSHPATGNCTACHMPRRRPSDAVHTTTTDHRIQKRPPPDPLGSLIEKHDGNTSPYRGQVALYYPSKLEKNAQNDLDQAVAQVMDDSNLEQGLRDLDAALTRYNATNSHYHFELGDGYRRAGDLQKAHKYYEEACAKTATDWRAFYRLGTSLTALDRLSEAREALDHSLRLHSMEPAIHEAIANLLSRQGKPAEAVTVLQKALAIDPDSASVYINLGARRLQLGDSHGAEQAWREAMRLRPESAVVRLNLGNLLAAHSDFREARFHFEAALRIAPGFPEARLAYALALMRAGDVKEAERRLREAIDQAPNLFEAHLKLSEILLARGELAAADHLQKAAQSPDARTREAALRLIEKQNQTPQR
jgi:predicted CXXCH cytochrome family protein